MNSASLSVHLRKRLKANWGESADSLNCFAEAKLYDPLSSWACYLLALDESELNVYCIIYTNTIGIEICTMLLQDLYNMYNREGEQPILDPEFRPLRAIELIRRLRNDPRRT